MFKKFLAALSLVAILSTGTAMADSDPAPVDTKSVTDKGYFSDFSVDHLAINPSAGDVANISFTLLQNAEIYSYVFSTVSNKVVTTFDTYTAKTAGAISYIWTGRQGNTVNGAVLPDGVYKVEAFARVGAVVQDSFVQYIYISSTNLTAPRITGLRFDPATFSPMSGDTTDAGFTTDKNGFLTAQILHGATVIRSFADYSNTYYDSGSFSIDWDGTDNNDNIVPDGSYTLKVTATLNGVNDLNINTAATQIVVSNSGSSSSGNGSVRNFYLDPAGTWNPLKGGLDIHYQLFQKVKSLHIQAQRTDGGITKVVKIVDDKNVDSGFYTENWDGTDDVGNYIDSGTWTINIIADGITSPKTITAAYTLPAVVEAFVSKDSFDPSKNEQENLVFKINAKADVTVEVLQGSQQEVKLIDEQEVQKNEWYTVPWDGRDIDGAEVDFASNWKFKITAKNPTAEDLLGTKSVAFAVAEDTVNDKKTNVTNDTTTPVVFDDQQSDTMEIDYSLDQQAQVFIAIYEGESTGGKAKATLLNYVAQDAGDHNVSWDGSSDTNGKKLVDGIYTYKIIAKFNNNYKETETGEFVIGNSGEYISPNPYPYTPTPTPVVPVTPVVPSPYPTPVQPPVYSQDCGGYVDTTYVANQNYDMCQAISWVTQQGIFSGYGDGSFGPNTPITRSEALKVVIKAFPNVTLLPTDGSNQGFRDADPAQWYMPFIRTAKFYNMLQGYNDGTAGVIKHVTRAEFLKFALMGSAAFTGYQVPNYSFSYYADVNANNSWYRNYAGVAYDMGLFGYTYTNGSTAYLYPEKEITRGEVALVLYKMNSNYLLGSSQVSYNNAYNSNSYSGNNSYTYGNSYYGY